MNELNQEQRTAAEFLDGIAAVIAVPGSGKTRTMMERIGLLVKRHGIPPENILGLTFTRNAAEEMRQRLIPVLGEMASRVTLSTIHSFCFFLLKAEGRVFEILSGKEQIIFVREILKKLKLKELSIGMVLREVSLAKNNLIDVWEFRVLYTGDKTMQSLADVYELYDREKARKMLMDFDDLLIEAYRLLSDSEDVRGKYREIFRHLLVDEFQDTNPAQMEILKLLMGRGDKSGNGHGSFWVCGDDWQAIYGFVGSTIGNIINFKETFPGARQFILNLNYRSTRKILTACQNLIEHNKRKIEKTLITQNGDGEDVIVLESSSEETEALIVLHEIRDLTGRGEFAFADIAVLYRCNFQSRVIEEAFCQHKIPYHIENGQNFYDRREVKVLLDYLRVISDPDSDKGDLALESILNVPNRYIGKRFIRELADFSSDKSLSLYRGLKQMPIELPYVRRNVKTFVEFMDPLIGDLEILRPAELIGLLRVSLDYDRAITDEDIPSPDDVKVQNLNQLQLAAARFETISSFLDYAETFKNESVSDNKEGVNLMTVHKAKGLEFPVVFLIGMVEGIMPSKRGDIEEERRICFVGMSRAMELLYLSFSHSYLGQTVKKSVFLDEIRNP